MQVANCGFTSAYALYLRSVMDKVSEHTTDRQKMDEFSMVYYNNLLSVPPILVLMLFFGEHRGLLQQPALSNPSFLLVALLGALIGFGISFSALWFLSQTTATIYSLVGALNKIPVAVVGILAFHEASSAQNLASIFIGLLVRCRRWRGLRGWGFAKGRGFGWRGRAWGLCAARAAAARGPDCAPVPWGSPWPACAPAPQPFPPPPPPPAAAQAGVLFAYAKAKGN
jgi:hypothetical protein